ncbi:MAG: hypothetical protein V9E83_01570 [Baekduia sp.]
MCERTFVSRMACVVCIVLPRFSFVVAAGGSRAALALGPAALAPQPSGAGGSQAIGEISPAAEAFGIHQGMRLGEALARCPELALIPADPLGTQAAWEEVVRRIEGIGAEVESPEAGVAFFDAGRLARLHGQKAPPAAVRAGGGVVPLWLPGVLTVARDGLRTPARIGAGPSRFCAHAGALRARSRACEFVDGAAALHDEPVGLLRTRAALEPVVPVLERLGLVTLGDVVRVGRPQLSGRFGRLGEQAHDLARGIDTPLSPRVPGDCLEEALELPDAGSGEQLLHAAGLLVDRLLARPERRGRALRSVVVGARLVEGGTWRARVAFRAPLADAGRIRLVLDQQLLRIPAPASTLELRVERFGPRHAAAMTLLPDDKTERRRRLGAAVTQARLVGGRDAALRVLELDGGSRIPERRLALTPLDP